MDPAGPIARRFPLIARPRPACTVLSTRVGDLAALADRAAREADLAAASRVLNQAALIASDCHQPDLARQWCHRHAHAYLRARPLSARYARLALEPLVNLARLKIRAGDGDAAFHLIDGLFEAASAHTDTVIDGIDVPLSNLLGTDNDHRELGKWLWTVHLADGTRALTSAGRWQHADAHLRRRNGVGNRMLDGRQVAVIARATAGDMHGAMALISTTAPGEAWEDAVTACLAELCREGVSHAPAGPDELIRRFRQLDHDPRLAVFRTRLGLSIVDTIRDVHPAALDLTRTLFQDVIDCQDGYAASDLLTHQTCIALLTDAQRRDLAAVLTSSGLGNQLPEPLHDRLAAAVASSEAVITTAAGDSLTVPRRALRPVVG